MSEFNPLNTQASSLLRHMASYMPALTPVIVRPRNTSRLFATPTPDDKRAAGRQNEESDADEVASSSQPEDGLQENRNVMKVANTGETTPTATASV